MWWDSDDATLGLYYNDGNSSQWVNINHGPSGPQGAQGATGAQGHQGVQGTAGSSITINNNASTRFITATGSATSLDGESNLTYNNSVVTFASSSLLVDKSANPTISVKETSGNKEVQLRANTTGGLLRTAGSYPLVLGTNQTERLRIDPSGNITSNMGNTAITSGYNYELRHSATYAIKISNAGNSKHIRIGCGDPEIASTGGEFDIRTTDTNAIKFKTDNTERFRIDSTGQSYFKETVGIRTDNVTRANLSNPVGAGHSLVGMYIGDGSLLFNNTLNRTGGYYISTETNALNAGPVTLDANMKVDGAWVIV